MSRNMKKKCTQLIGVMFFFGVIPTMPLYVYMYQDLISQIFK